MSWKKHFQIAQTANEIAAQKQSVGNNSHVSTNKFTSWLKDVYSGAPNRTDRYAQYDMMDQDSDINAALDTISEFCTQFDYEHNLPFTIDYFQDPTEAEVSVLEKSLRQWCMINNWNKRAWRTFRNAIKYGDQFFIRDPETYELYWVDPANIEKVVVNESEGKKIEQYFIKNLEANFAEQVATNASGLHARPYGSGQGLTGIMSPTNTVSNNYLTGSVDGAGEGVPVDAKHVVHVSLTEGMDHSWPFGVSILEPIFKVFKQKELLEDSIIIYRVHRAPERRVFFIDVGNMPAHKAQQYLERVKYEVQQKRVPNSKGDGSSVTDSAYNPMSMLEDYFFAQTADGRGSKVDTLPGGENLGQIDDLRYFNNKLLRGLRIPASYLPTGPDDGSATYNDGKVGVAYIQEYRFAKYVERLQKQVQEDLDREFKLFLKYKGIDIDNSGFRMLFNKPMNFSSYRELQLNTERAQMFNQVANLPYMSKRFALQKYMGLSDNKMKQNEEQWREENDYQKYQDNEKAAALKNIGIRPEPNAAVDLDAEPDLSGLEDPTLGGEDINTTIDNTVPPAEGEGLV